MYASPADVRLGQAVGAAFKCVSQVSRTVNIIHSSVPSVTWCACPEREQEHCAGLCRWWYGHSGVTATICTICQNHAYNPVRTAVSSVCWPTAPLCNLVNGASGYRQHRVYETVLTQVTSIRHAMREPSWVCPNRNLAPGFLMHGTASVSGGCCHRLSHCRSLAAMAYLRQVAITWVLLLSARLLQRSAATSA